MSTINNLPKWEVTINCHMALHIADVVSDYGPPHVYWCFAYERMNGILTGTPNSNRNIEPQILRNILQQFTYASEFYDLAVPSGIDMCMPKALKNIVPVERLLYPDSYRVLALLIQPEGQDRFAFQRAIDQGDVQDWPIRMQHPSKCNVRVDEDFYQQIVEFCNNTYDGDVYVKHQIDKYGRCSVNGQTFSSDFNSTDRGSIVKAMFVLKDNGNLHPYFWNCKVFFFKINIIMKDINKKSILKGNDLMLHGWHSKHLRRTRCLASTW